MAVDLDHHLFDALYHATALEYDACLITADDRYHRKARTLAGIVHLRDWRARLYLISALARTRDPNAIDRVSCRNTSPLVSHSRANRRRLARRGY